LILHSSNIIKNANHKKHLLHYLPEFRKGVIDMFFMIADARLSIVDCERLTTEGNGDCPPWKL
jgi:hypothetical protein